MESSKEDLIESKNLQGNFRELLEKLINDSSVEVILVGEKHGTSPTDDAFIANLDILSGSKRPIIFVLERLTQKQNDYFQEAFKKKKVTNAKNLIYNDYMLYQFFVDNGIRIFGVENEKSLPYINLPQDDRETVAKMGKYAGSLERITNANAVFSEFINTLLIDNKKSNPIIIFIGGASHIIEAIQEDEKLLDQGMQSRIKNSVSIIIDFSTVDTFKHKHTYQYAEHRLKGITDYFIGIMTPAI